MTDEQKRRQAVSEGTRVLEAALESERRRRKEAEEALEEERAGRSLLARTTDEERRWVIYVCDECNQPGEFFQAERCDGQSEHRGNHGGAVRVMPVEDHETVLQSERRRREEAEARLARFEEAAERPSQFDDDGNEYVPVQRYVAALQRTEGQGETPDCNCASRGLTEEWRHSPHCPYGYSARRLAEAKRKEDEAGGAPDGWGMVGPRDELRALRAKLEEEIERLELYAALCDRRAPEAADDFRNTASRLRSLLEEKR